MRPLCCGFQRPHSATGEDVAEFHIHGGRAVIASIIDAILTIDGVRLADPGEFTRRAFENGKLDLTDAEGLDDLIHADTEQQRRQALRQMKGLLGDQAESWRKQIIEASALIEAHIDFADESDVPDDLVRPALAKVAALRDAIRQTLASSARSERLRDGLVVAIAGAPNVGKSTLLNALARREAAIVSPIAGTTRDVIEVHLDLEGYPVTLLDTAGIRETDDAIEQEGVRRARDRAAAADLVLWLTDGSDGESPASPLSKQSEVWIIRNKTDLGTDELARASDGHPRYEISAALGHRLDGLIGALVTFAEAFFATGGNALITRARHRELLEQTSAALGRAMENESVGAEVVAEELRLAARALGCLVGRVDVEDLLDVIFRDFCIGK